MTRFETYLDNQEAVLKNQEEALRAQQAQLHATHAASAQNAAANAAQLAQQQRIVGRLDALAQEAQQQTALQEQAMAEQQQAHADQLNYQFKMWRQTEDGRHYLAWEARARAFIAYLQNLDREFKKVARNDFESYVATAKEWGASMRNSKPSGLYRLMWLAVTIAVIFPFVFAGFFPKLNHGFGPIGGWFVTSIEVVVGFILGVLLSLLGYGLYSLCEGISVKRRVRVVLSETPGASEGAASLRAGFACFAHISAEKQSKTDEDFLARLYRDDVPDDPERLSFSDPSVAAVIFHVERIIDTAPETLPVDLPEFEMPAAIDPATLPDGTGARQFVAAYASALAAG